jgi:protein-arginine kinase
MTNFCTYNVQAIKEMEKKLTFAHHDKLGYLTFCPTNLGTTCRASVHIKIPKLAAQPDFKEFCEKLNLQPRGISLRFSFEYIQNRLS